MAAQWCGGQHRLNYRLGLFCVESACSPRVCGVLSRYSSFLPPSKNMPVTLIVISKFVLRSECGCLPLCGPVIDWPHVQGVPLTSHPMTAGIGSTPLPPDRRIKRVYKMDGWMLCMDECAVEVLKVLHWKQKDVSRWITKSEITWPSFNRVEGPGGFNELMSLTPTSLAARIARSACKSMTGLFFMKKKDDLPYSFSSMFWLSFLWLVGHWVQ